MFKVLCFLAIIAVIYGMPSPIPEDEQPPVEVPAQVAADPKILSEDPEKVSDEKDLSASNSFGWGWYNPWGYNSYHRAGWNDYYTYPRYYTYTYPTYYKSYGWW